MLGDNALVGRDAAKAYIGLTDTDRDLLVDQLIMQASEWILGNAEQEFAPLLDGATRRLEYRGDGVIYAVPFSLRAVTSITFGPGLPGATVADAGSWQLRAAPAGRRYGVYDRIELATPVAAVGAVQGVGYVDVTGSWGWPKVPDDVQRAAFRLVELWFRSEIAFGSDEYGTATPLPMGVPIDVRDVVASYKRTRVGGV